MANAPGPYSCTDKLCADFFDLTKGVPEFAELQRQINRFAGVAKFRPIAADGKIGAATVAAGRAAFTWISRNEVLSISLPWDSTVPRVWAANSQMFTSLLQTYADRLPRTPSVDVPMVAPPPSARKKSQAFFLLGGGLLFGWWMWQRKSGGAGLFGLSRRRRRA